LIKDNRKKLAQGKSLDKINVVSGIKDATDSKLLKTNIQIKTDGLKVINDKNKLKSNLMLST